MKCPRSETCKKKPIPSHQTLSLFHNNRTKVIYPSGCKGGLIWFHSIRWQVNHFLLQGTAQSGPDKAHMIWELYEWERYHQSANNPKLLTKAWENMLPSAVTNLFMNLLYQQSRNRGSCRQNGRITEILWNWCIPNTSANSENAIHHDGIKRCQSAAFGKRRSLIWL